jgi:hypothetical protein
MKVEKEKITIIIIIIILIYSWLPTFWMLSEDSGDLEFFLNSKSGEFGSFFFPMKNPYV